MTGDAVWNFDLSSAPTDGSWIWAACASGEVIRTQWLAPHGKARPVGRWLSLGSKETPIAWTAYVKPKHPFA